MHLAHALIPALVVATAPAAGSTVGSTVASAPCTGTATARIAAHPVRDGRSFRYSVGRAVPGSEWRVRTSVVQEHPRAPSGFEYVDTLTADEDGRVITRMTTDWRSATATRMAASSGDQTCRVRLAIR